MRKRKNRSKQVLAAALAMATAFAIMPLNPQEAYAFTGYNALTPGVYAGSGVGYGGTLKLNVTVDVQGNVSAIDVTEHEETIAYYQSASSIIDTIINEQSVDVDVVSNATYTCNAIKTAVKEALGKATVGFAGGTGTKEDPFLVSSEAGLRYVQEQAAAGTSYEGQYIKLNSNLTLTGEWTPIGSSSMPFSGHFDGANHVISNLTITGSNAYAGLFGYAASGAQFTNIVLDDVQISAVNTAASYAGAVVAFMKNDTSGNTISAVDHCSASGSINVTSGDNMMMVGGLIGMSNQRAAVTNSYSSVNVTADSGSKVGNVGGMIGMASAKLLLMNNAVSGTVQLKSTSNKANAGGLTGTLNGIAYNNSSTAAVSGTEDTVRAGSLAGNAAEASYIANSYYVGDQPFGTAPLTYDTTAISSKTADEIASDDMALLLHNNLKADALNVMEAAVTKANITDCTDFTALMDRVDSKFYDWSLNTKGVAAPTNNLWVSTEYDASIFDSGTGTVEDPYMIASGEQLSRFATSLNRELDYQGLYVKLAGNIDVSAAEWTPIGEGEYAFQGNFDGAGYAINGVRIGTKENPHQDSGEIYYGLFGVLGSHAVVTDLTVDAAIYAQGNASIYVSGLAGYVERSTINHVTVNGTVWGKSGIVRTAANHFSGGLAGLAYRAVIRNCVSNVDVYGEATGGVGESGGIAGLNNRSLIANCIATGFMSGSADRVLEGMAAVGGISGVHVGVMTNCMMMGDTSSLTYSQYVGALAGWTTGIGELYGNYFNADASQKIENQVVNPVVSIGWLVGPGINDEGEAYTGGIEYQSVALAGTDLAAEALSAKLNSTFTAFPVNMANYSQAALYEWQAENGAVLPNGAAVTVTYLEPDIEIPTTEEQKYSGVYYGRSADKTLIVKLTVENSVILQADVISNETGADVTTMLAQVVSGNSTNGIAQTETAGAAVVSAVETALARMPKNDTTAYGKADPSIFAGGNGTKENPYKIAAADQLTAFANALNADESFDGIYIELTENLTLSGQWKPAGTDAHYPFKGFLNGNGHSISGLMIGTSEQAAQIQYAGLFAYIEGGTVTNLKLQAPYIHTESTGSGRIYAGALAAFVDNSGNRTSYYDQCDVVDGAVNMQSASGAAYAGGLFGSAQYGTIVNSSIDADISVASSGSWCYGGVMSAMFARMGAINNKVTGEIHVSAPLNKAAIGGLAGFHSGASYNNVSDVTLISAGTTGDVGALAGRNTGIGMMLTGYFNREKQQTVGNSVTTAAAVGTLVNGENDGQGAAENLTALTAAQLHSQETIDALNANTLSNSEAFAKIKTLLNSSWKVVLPEDVKMHRWADDGVLPALTAQVNEEPADDSTTDNTQTDTVSIKKVSGLTAKSAGVQSIKLTWKKVSNATGYEIYRATAKNGTYKKIAAVSSKKLTYTNKKLTTGKTYYYKVRAIRKSANKTTRGAYSSVKSAKPTLAAVTISSAKNTAGKKVVLKWKKVSGASGYTVYRANKKNGKYTAVSTMKSAKKVTYTSKKLSKKTYYYKIRAYKTVNGKKVYGAYSKVKTVKVNK